MSIQRFMIDIETLGTKPDSIILSIGCAAFNTNRIGDFGIGVPPSIFRLQTQKKRLNIEL